MRERETLQLQELTTVSNTVVTFSIALAVLIIFPE
jgi:hypothetical protein